MRNTFTLLFLSFISFVFAQTNFESGYFVTNNGNRIECLIKNIDWLHSPEFFEYRLSDVDEVKIASMNDVQLFEILDKSKYIRVGVDIDISSDDISNLTSNRAPIFKQKQVFLKQLVAGDANLYSYRSGQKTYFFYNLSDGDIKPLVYKRYLIEGNKIAYNVEYKQELLNNLNCNAITENMIVRTDYDEKDLVKLFNKYNLCKNPNFKPNETTNVSKGKFNLTIRPRVNFSKFSFSRQSMKYDFENSTNFGAGLNFEYILPFNNNKWSVFIDPNYIDVNQSMKVATTDIKLKYNVIEMPIGIKYRMFLNEYSKIYFSAAYVIDFNLKSNFKTFRGDTEYINVDLKSQPNYAFAVGYSYKNKYSIEVRTTTKKNVTKNLIYWDSSLTSTSIILGYTIF